MNPGRFDRSEYLLGAGEAEERVFGRLGELYKYKREKPHMKIAVVAAWPSDWLTISSGKCRMLISCSAPTGFLNCPMCSKGSREHRP